MRTPWSKTDNPMSVSVRLYCGCTIIASELDGGMDEVPRITWKLLERVVMERVTAHAIQPTDCSGYGAVEKPQPFANEVEGELPW